MRISVKTISHKSHFSIISCFAFLILFSINATAQSVADSLTTESGGRVLVHDRFQMLGIAMKEHVAIADEIAKMGTKTSAIDEMMANYRRMIKFLHDNRPRTVGLNLAIDFSDGEAKELRRKLWHMEVLLEDLVRTAEFNPRTSSRQYEFAKLSIDHYLPDSIKDRISRQHKVFVESRSKPAQIQKLLDKLTVKKPIGIAGLLALAATGHAVAGNTDASPKSTVGAGAGSRSRVVTEDSDFGDIPAIYPTTTASKAQVRN